MTSRCSDVSVLCEALAELLLAGKTSGVDSYSECCLRRVWRAQDFSNYMMTLLHRFDTGPFDEQVQIGRLEYVRRSEAAARSLAENYAGLPFGW
jgi:p-hydroxybenzoate 3-monooxygenase